MQIAWPVSFSNFHCAANDHILLNAPELSLSSEVKQERNYILLTQGTGWEELRVLSAVDAWWHANSPLLGATTCPLGVWRLMLLLLAAAKQVGLRCSQGFARSTGDVRQPGRLVSGGYPGRRLVCSRASSMYWFKVSFLCEVLSAFDAWWHANSPLLGATICPLGVWRLMLLLLAAAKQVGLRCSQGFARSTGDVRQPGRLVRWLSRP